MTVISQLPTPPSRKEPVPFAERTDAFLGALPGFVTETNAVASEVNADKVTAVDSAALAVTKAAEAAASAAAASVIGTSTKWVSGASYAEGAGVWSPINYLPYRRIVAGAGTTDPANDSTNWRLAARPGMPRVARTSNVQLEAIDNGSFIDITSGTFSQTFTSAATLGGGWCCWIKNSGTGTITLDPNSSELIDGASTYTLYPSRSVLVICTGSALQVVQDVGPKQIRLPIFSTEAASKTGVSVLEDIAFPTYSTNLAASISSNVTYGNSLFIVNSTDSQGNVSTSPDGITWTLRAMPSSAAWSIGTNGTNKFIATVGAATTVAKSTNGTTWTSGTALPGNAGSNIPIFNGDTCLVAGSSGTQCYISSDNGSTWSAVQTLPGGGTSVYGQIFVINGLFWLIVGAAETTTAYTSSTGLTGSWTARTLPISASHAYTQRASDGKLNISSNTAGVLMYESADGINWTSIGIANITGVQSAGLVINGVRFWASVTFPRSSTVHNGIRVQRTASLPCNAYLGNYATNGTVFCFSNISGVSSNNIQRFSSDATVPTAIFEG